MTTQSIEKQSAQPSMTYDYDGKNNILNYQEGGYTKYQDVLLKTYLAYISKYNDPETAMAHARTATKIYFNELVNKR